MIITSKGNRHINGHKELTAHKEILDFRKDETVCKYVYFPLICPNGKEVNKVKESGKVKVGTKLMVRSDFDIPVYSSVSGEIVGIENRYSAIHGKKVDHLVIENDFKYSESKLKTIDIDSASKIELIEAIKQAGIVGLGGAGFPTYIKYNTNATIDTILVNGVECEPYLTTDYVSMINDVDALLKGCEIVKKISGASEVIIVFKKNKKDLIELLNKKLENNESIKVKLVKDRYPFGWEKALVRNVLKREYETLPSEVNVIVNNVQTIISVYKALIEGMPIVNRVITVSGDCISNPRNVLVPIGTSAKNIINGFELECEDINVLAGGPMTSKACISDEFAIYLNHGAITLMKNKKIVSESCLRCGKCIENCPSGLQPIQIKEAYERKDLDDLEIFQVNKCVECGLCSYICPSRIELTDNLKKAKAYLRLSKTKKGE